MWNAPRTITANYIRQLIFRLWDLFDRVDEDQSGYIDATELRKRSFDSGFRYDAYTSPRDRAAQRRFDPCVPLKVDLTGWRRLLMASGMM
jgi:hypothetical protein